MREREREEKIYVKKLKLRITCYFSTTHTGWFYNYQEKEQYQNV